MKAIDPSIPKDVLERHKLGQIISAQKLGSPNAIQNAPETIYVVNHYSTDRMVGFEQWGDHTRIYLNNYILGTINNACLALVFHDVLEKAGFDAQNIATALGQKFLSERILSAVDHEMGRILFLESTFLVDPAIRALILEHPDQNARQSVSDFINHLSSDFITFHEIGHHAARDTRFNEFNRATLEFLETVDGFEYWQGDDRNRIFEEVRADLFSISTLLARYAPTTDGASLKSYLSLVIGVLARTFLLDAYADDMIVRNVDDTYQPRYDVSRHLLEWTHREIAINAYLRSFAFGSDTVECASERVLPILDISEEKLEALVDWETMLEPNNDDQSRFWHLISIGFEQHKSFTDIVSSSHSSYLFERWTE